MKWFYSPDEKWAFYVGDYQGCDVIPAGYALKMEQGEVQVDVYCKITAAFCNVCDLIRFTVYEAGLYLKEVQSKIPEFNFDTFITLVKYDDLK